MRFVFTLRTNGAYTYSVNHYHDQLALLPNKLRVRKSQLYIDDG